MLSGDLNMQDAPLSKHERNALLAFVREGGRLVLIGAAVSADTFRAAGIPLPTTIQSRSSADVDRSFFRTPAKENAFPPRRLAGPFTRAFHRRNDVTVLARAGGAPIAVRGRLGRGTIVAVAETTAFSNAALAKADNARFAVALAHALGDRMAFDEALYGMSERQSFWQVVPAALRAALLAWVTLALLALGVAAVRNWPPDEPITVTSRTSANYLDALAELLRSGRARRHAVRIFAADAQQRVRGRGVSRAVAAGLRELGFLMEQVSLDDRDVEKAAIVHARVRKEIG